MLKTFPKRQYIRSPALLKACREIPCQKCGRADGTIVAAHSNSAAHGKGRSIKADDSRIAALCFTCHSAIDQGSGSGDERRSAWQSAHVKTVNALVLAGLWPQSVPIPDLRSFDA